MAQTSRAIRLDAHPVRRPTRTVRPRRPDHRPTRRAPKLSGGATNPVFLAWESLPRELRESYTMVDYLGKGATSVVFRAIQEELGREVVVKVLADIEDDTRERSFREAGILGRLRHQNVVRMFDYGDQPDLIYLVLEYLPGRSMCSWGPADRPDGDHILELALGIARGLSAIHDAGVIHRDLKPSNIWITDEGIPKILDLGLARDLRHGSTSPGGTFLGTLSHASPEQIEGKPLDGRSDLYSLGVILHQMITGCNPFMAENIGETIGRHLGLRVDRLPAGGMKLPPGLERVVIDLLQKDPARRPPSAHEVVRRLERMRKASIAISVDEKPAISSLRRWAGISASVPRRTKPFDLGSKRVKLLAFLLTFVPTLLGLGIAALQR